MDDESPQMGEEKLRQYLKKVTGDLRNAHRHIRHVEQAREFLEQQPKEEPERVNAALLEFLGGL